MSERKRAFLVLLGCLLVILGVIGLRVSNNSTKIGNNDYQLEVVNNGAERALGLSGRQSLAQDSGMLFVFGEVSKRCMWMKDMNFALDILWLDESGRIVAIEENVTPDTYPNSFCHDNSKYVVELNTGDVRNYNISIGQIVKL